MYYDAHTHINSPELFDDADRYFQNFIEIWWKSMIVAGANDEYNRNAIALAGRLRVKITLGLHPEILVGQAQIGDLQSKIENLRSLILENKNNVVAIGECGIELHFPWFAEVISQQKELFAMQCDLAQELNLPLLVHSRDWFDQALDVLKNYKNLTIYFHCRGYGPEQIWILQSLFKVILFW